MSELFATGDFDFVAPVNAYGRRFRGERQMKLARTLVWMLIAVLACGSWSSAQTEKNSKSAPAPTKGAPTQASPEQQTQDANIDAYIGLLRQDFRTKKAIVTAEVMKFNDD